MKTVLVWLSVLMLAVAVRADDDFAPYFTVKIVLVEEAGTLKVGYFEFLPPSLMD